MLEFFNQEIIENTSNDVSSTTTQEVIEANSVKMRSSNNMIEVQKFMKIEFKQFNDKLILLESKIGLKLKEDQHLQIISQLRAQLNVSERQLIKLVEKWTLFTQIDEQDGIIFNTEESFMLTICVVEMVVILQGLAVTKLFYFYCKAL